MSVQVNQRVLHNDETFEPGETITDITKAEGKRLVDLGVAFFVENNSEQSQKQSLNKSDAVDEELLQSFKDAYEYEELKKEAADVGLEFPGNISFKNLVKLIVDSGKVDEFFEEE